MNQDQISTIPNRAGIYLIECFPSKKVYVGSSNKVRRRIFHHISRLKAGKHGNGYLQKTWEKYGEADFGFFILEWVEESDALLPREQFWIDTLMASDERRGMNLCPIAGRTAGIKRTAEHIARVTAANTGRKLDPEIVERRAKLIKIGLARPGVQQRKAASTRKTFATPESRAKRSLASMGNQYARQCTWKVIDPSGQEQVLRNLNAFCKANGLDQAHLSRVAYGKAKTHKGWRCEKLG